MNPKSVRSYAAYFTHVLGVVVAWCAPVLAQTVTYNYDDQAVSTYGVGRLTSVVDESGTTTFFYDSMGRVERTDKVVDGTTYTTRTHYDLVGRVDAVTYPDSTTTNYAYNGPHLGWVYDSATTYAAYVGYNEMGQPAEVRFGNGVTTQYTYGVGGNSTCPQPTYRPCTIKTGVVDPGTNTIPSPYQNLTYGYYADGDVQTITDPINGTQTFEYDELNRLTSAVGSYGTLTYAYDEIGNLICNSQISACTAATPNYSYPTNGVRPHAVSQAGTTTYLYDGNGNMESGAGRTLTYDAWNRLTGVQTAAGTATFVYDGDGGRVKKTAGGITTTYIGKLYECKASCTKYIFAGDQRIAMKPVGGTQVTYYHADHLGSNSVLTRTDAFGNPVQVGNLAYFPFGGTRLNSGPVDPAHKFTGQELDDSTSLYFYGSRYYDPALARFVSPDTVVPNPNDPQDLNRYSYVNNNPIRYTDPTGHWKLSNFLRSVASVAGWVFAPQVMATIWAIQHPQQALQIATVAAGVAMTFAGVPPVWFIALGVASNAGQAALAGGDFGMIFQAAVTGAVVGAFAAEAGAYINGAIVGGNPIAATVTQRFLGAVAAGAGGGFVQGAGTAALYGGNILRGGYQGAAVGAASAAIMFGLYQAYQRSRVAPTNAAEGDAAGPIDRGRCYGDYGCGLEYEGSSAVKTRAFGYRVGTVGTEGENGIYEFQLTAEHSQSGTIYLSDGLPKQSPTGFSGTQMDPATLGARSLGSYSLAPGSNTITVPIPYGESGHVQFFSPTRGNNFADWVIDFSIP